MSHVSLYDLGMAQVSEAEMTIDELASATGLTARNIRAYQSRGLLPPPQLRARTGYYGEEHLARLRQIRELQAEGFNLEAIKKLLELSAGGRGEAVSFQRDLLNAFGDEKPEAVSNADLERSFGAPLDPAMLRKAERMGALRPLGDGAYEARSPTLLSAAAELIELGIPVEHAIAVGEKIARNVRSISKEFVRLFVQDILGPLEQSKEFDAEGWARARDALERLRPLASEAVLAAFGQAMADAVEREIEKRT
jgi:DNA-binding transcriptional MerR regulator